MTFPVQLGRLVSFNVILPPAELLGNYLTPGKPRELLQWLVDSAPAADASIISLDMLIYGGLIASRNILQDEDEILENLESLVHFLEKRPIRTIYGSGVIMRNTPTYTSPGVLKELPFFLKIVNELYTVSMKEPELLESRIRQAERQLRGSISGERYFRARRRNHEINKRFIELQKKGHLDHLILGIDDVVTKGLNLYEKKLLEEKARGNNGISIYPGTDEMSMMLLSMLGCRHFRSAPGLSLLYSSVKGMEKTPLYEDRSIADLAESYIRLPGATIVKAMEDSDIVLGVHILPRGQKEAVWQHLRRTGRGQIESFVAKVQDLMESGKAVSIADIAYANGADSLLAACLRDHIRLPELSGYAAWNTAGNSLGTVIPQSILRWLSLKFRHRLQEPRLAEKSHHQFTFSRLVDDWLYQSDIRQKAGAHCQGKSISIFDLGKSHPNVERMVKTMILPGAEDIFRRAFAGRYNLPSTSTRKARFSIGDPLRLSVRLPWPRIFEVDVECDFSFDYEPSDK